MDKKIGHYSFIIGVIIAVLLGLIPATMLGGSYKWIASLLVVLGLVVGFLNVPSKETKEFLLVAVVLVITAGVGTGASSISVLKGVTVIGPWLAGVFEQLLAFIIPATVVVALKDILALAKNN